MAAYYQSWHQWSVALIAAIIADFSETERVHHQGNIKLKKKRKKGETKDGEKRERTNTADMETNLVGLLVARTPKKTLINHIIQSCYLCRKP